VEVLADVYGSLNDTYHEQRDALNRDIDTEEAECANVIVDVGQRSVHMVRCDTLVLLCAVLHPQSLERDPTLALIEKPGLVWACRHKERRTKAGQDSNYAFEEKNIAPRVDDHARGSPWGNTSKPKG
jgi:hypothetical protein